jgi:hypothetical protein
LWWGSLPNSVYGYRVTNLSELLAELLSWDNKTNPWAMVLIPIYRIAARWHGVRIEDSIIMPTVWKLALAAVAMLVLLIWLERDFFFQTARRMGLLPFFAGTLVQAGYYKRFGSVPQKSWYWISEAVFIVLCMALLLMLVYRLLERFKARWPQNLALVVMLAVTFYFPLDFVNYLFGELRNGRIQETHDYIDRARFLSETFEPGTVIGIPGSGSWGYFSPDMVIFNMDGLINSYEYLEAMRSGRGAEFMADSGMQYVIGNPYIMENTNPYGPILEGHLEMFTKYFPPYSARKFVWRFVP